MYLYYTISYGIVQVMANQSNEAQVAREPKTEQVGAMVTKAMAEQIADLAKRNRWSIAETARYLMERGLEADAELKAVA